MPPRSTRSANKEADTPGSKRKRRSSPESPLNVVLPSPASLPKLASASPEKVNGDVDHESKRQKLSLKINLSTEKPKDVKEEHPVDGALKKEIRESLSEVIAQMSVDLPPPLNNILALWLPPSFAQKEENTLGYVLKQPSLTWDQLVDTIHLFSENLLVPCQYPNPVPARAQFHLPVPPLPSHFPPHIIYNFCASMHSLLLEIEPKGGHDGVSIERWALTQKTPQAGEWFTSAVDSREVQKRKGKDGDLLESLAAKGDSFANANAISLQSTFGGDASHNSPTLSDSLIRRASLKMNRWKERRAQRGSGGFGSVPRGVTSVAFTPSFGPTFDSYHATGGQGYWSTLEGMHERARHREWARRALRRSKNIDEGGYCGNLETNKGKEKETIDDVLTENGELIEELQTWQEVRTRKGVFAVTEREQHVAEELLSSLAKLTGSRPPVDMLPASTSKVGLAHELARRFLSVSSPSIRGTLDPRRPQALHDNVTVKPRTMAGQTLGGSTNPMLSSPHAPPPIKLGVMPPPPIPQYVAPPPHTLPVGGRSNDNNRPSSTPSRSSYAPHSPSPSIGNTIYNNRPTSTSTPPANPANTAPYPRSVVGPGPSNLRQSFGPGTPGTPSSSSNGIGYGMNGLGSASVRGMMMPGTSR
ncbi:hypothetical protein L486_08308 [Kwoniella mangroviensis CBS 10435]|uniref:Uncharacterized protein n=1 Tax=Kwoniella mangroviensis CBS 10435 TaxID=1331196 RepID=A0A1B9IFA6_9TREE|nr:hypothetical protein L486_08308 [Kwoniella mangroviensis CBS 10435]